MECEWSVDEVDGCTLQVHCRMKDACQTNECFDVDTLLDRALHAPRDVISSNKIITGSGANFTDQCTANYGKICPHVEPTSWTDYLPSVDTTPLVSDYVYPAYNGTAHVLSSYVFSPINSWLVTPAVDYIYTPLCDYVFGPVWHFIVATLHAIYDYLPSPDYDSWWDINTLEFFIHFLACVLTVSALVIVLFVYFCYVFTDKAKFGVVTRHPLKETPPEKPGPAATAACTPGCTQNHVHRSKGSHDVEAERRLSGPPKVPSGTPVAGSGSGGGSLFSGLMGRRRRGSQDLHRKMTQIAASFDRSRSFAETEEYELRRGLAEEREQDVDHMARNACVLQ